MDIYMNGLELEKELGHGECHYPNQLIADNESCSYPKFISWNGTALFLSKICKDDGNIIGYYCRPATTGNFVKMIDFNKNKITEITEEDFMDDNGFAIDKVYDENYYRNSKTWYM